MTSHEIAITVVTRAVERAVGGELAHWPHNPERYFGLAAGEIVAALDAAGLLARAQCDPRSAS